MPEVACPKCGKPYKLTGKNAGRGFLCPCGCHFFFPPLTDPTDIAIEKAKEYAPIVAAKGRAAAQKAAEAAREYAPVVAKKGKAAAKAVGAGLAKYVPAAGRGVKKWVPLVLWWVVWQPVRGVALAVTWPGRWWWRRRQARRRAEEEYWAGREEVRDLAEAWPEVLKMSFNTRRPPTLDQFAYGLSLGVLPVRASKASMMLSITAAKQRADAGRPLKPLLLGLGDEELALVYEFLCND